jgi:hypothetical protein
MVFDNLALGSIFASEIRSIDFRAKRKLLLEADMVKMIFILFVVLGFVAAGEVGFGQTLYKWVDEKGTVHFSENPPPKNKEEKKKGKGNPSEILKRLEVGNRTIPEDMKKYGPA